MLPDRFDPRYYEPEVLFRYHAGWAGLSHTRASGATLIDRTGTLQEVGPNVPRIDWSRGVPALLLEPQRTNLVPSPRLDTDSDGNGFPDGVLASAHADYTVTPLSMSDGTFTYRVERVADTGGWGGGIRINIPGIVQGDVLSGGLDVLVTPGSTPLVGATWCFWEYVDDATGQLVMIPAVRYPGDGQWHRLLAQNVTLANPVRANTFRLIVRSGGSSDPIGGSVTVSVRRPQMERGPTASSFVVGTRALELAIAPLHISWQEGLALYFRGFEAGSVALASEATEVSVYGGDTNIRIRSLTQGAGYSVRLVSGAAAATSGTLAPPTIGQPIEHLLVLQPTGAFRLDQSIDGGPISSVSSAGVALPRTAATTVQVNGLAGPVNTGMTMLRDLIVLRGAGWTMDQVRAYLPGW